MAPFREFLALVILDGDFDLPQHLSVDPAHRRAQLGGGFRGVEIEDAQEILMLEAVVRFKPAAGHERVGNADGGGALEGRSYVELIIPVKKGIVNDGEDILLIVPPVFLRKLRRDALKLVREPSFFYCFLFLSYLLKSGSARKIIRLLHQFCRSRISCGAFGLS